MVAAFEVDCEGQVRSVDGKIPKTVKCCPGVSSDGDAVLVVPAESGCSIETSRGGVRPSPSTESGVYSMLRENLLEKGMSQSSAPR